MSNYFITTAIPYVNGDPHLGHAMEFVMGDVLARHKRQLGEKVIYSLGTDEHGSKVAEKAAEAGLPPEKFADQNTAKFVELFKNLNISNDRFIRTTDAAHIKRSQKIWKDLGDTIYKGTYSGWYCVGCEEYVSEQKVKENKGICPEHNRPYEKLEEENYFFALSRFNEQVKEAVNGGSFKILPASRKNEILSVLNEGLEDISISRPKDKISWGIPVPGDPNQVMYVWFEALLNYITVLGYPEHEDYKNFWPANMQIIGKGVLRFHAAIWPGILLALKQPLPQVLYVHGYITVGGDKMGKSLGNSVSPDEVIKRYGADTFRYYFLRHIPSYEDGDFTWERLEAAYNNELADQLGNAVSRTVAMILKYQEGLIGDTPDPSHDVAKYTAALEDCRFDVALNEVWEQVKGLNQYIEEVKPWQLAKQKDMDHVREVLAYLAGSLVEIAELLTPFMPDTAERIKSVFSGDIVKPLKESLFPKELKETA